MVRLVRLCRGVLAVAGTAALLTTCGGDNAVTRGYDAAAVQAKATEMVRTNELVGPQGKPISAEDLAALLQIVQEACKGPGKIQAMAGTLSANLYLMTMAFKLANAGCPDVVKASGIQVNT